MDREHIADLMVLATRNYSITNSHQVATALLALVARLVQQVGQTYFTVKDQARIVITELG